MKVFGFAASADQRTTLIENLLPLLVGQGLRVSVIKHAHHTFDVDRPGKVRIGIATRGQPKCWSVPVCAGR